MGLNADVVMNKAATIERCLLRIQEVYQGDPENLNDFTKQDSMILNIQRACEASIDLAMHVVSSEKLGLPQSSRDAFEILEQTRHLDSELTHQLKAMVGFRNLAVHAYQEINLEILQVMIESKLSTLTQFKRWVFALLPSE